MNTLEQNVATTQASHHQMSARWPMKLTLTFH